MKSEKFINKMPNNTKEILMARLPQEPHPGPYYLSLQPAIQLVSGINTSAEGIFGMT